MKSVSVKIKNKKYTIVFGYGVTKKFCELHNLPGYTSFNKYLVSIDEKSKSATKDIDDDAFELSFEYIDFVGDLVYASISYQLGKQPKLSKNEIIDALFAQNLVMDVLSAFLDSQPKAQDEGKPIPESQK